MSGAARLRELADQGGPLVLPGVYDGLSARIAVQSGFGALVVGGYSVAASRLGMPDFGFLTQTEISDAARDICAAVPGIPVVVDADTGYGNALSAARTARLLHRAGAAGMILEDQEWPKRCGHMAGKRIVPAADWLAKIRAVVDLRDEGVDMFLIARTDARGLEGLDEGLARGRAAAAAGADAVFVEAPETIAELEQIATALGDVVLVANMVETGRTPLLTPAELADLGFRLIVSPLSLLFSAVQAMQQSLAQLAAEGSLRNHLDRLVDFDTFGRIVGLGELFDIEQRYR